MIAPGKVKLAIVQPTAFCNLNCRYCYLPDKTKQTRMQIDTLDHIFRFLFSSPTFLDDEELSIVWVAGEPLTVPVWFYEKALELQRRLTPSGIVVKHYFQTNATLLTQAWCDFIKSSDWNIGVSLDGPARFHDARRIDRLGHGTYDRVMRAIGLLRENSIRFDIIAVLSRDSLRYVDEVFELYRSLAPVQLCLNCEEIVGANQFSSFCDSDACSQLTDFFAAFLKLRDAYAPGMRIRETDSLLSGIIEWRRPFIWMDAVPLRIVSFSWKGDVSTFSPELIGLQNSTFDNFVFGNVFADDLGGILMKPSVLLMQGQIENGIRLCRNTCDYFGICGGGSPARKLAENGSFESAETNHCKLRVKAISEAALQHLERGHHVGNIANASILERVKLLMARNSQAAQLYPRHEPSLRQEHT